MFARHAELLTAAQVGRIHERSLDVLEDVGVLVRNRKARERFAHFGCRVDRDAELVRFPRAVVEEFRAAIPTRFTFHARDERYSKTIPDDALVVATASSAPNLIDPDSGAERRSRSDDIARIGHLVNLLDGIDV
ncbi:MAG: trimethylamine methyltransferase family protein, partial [Lysobacterales bacterium]